MKSRLFISALLCLLLTSCLICCNSGSHHSESTNDKSTAKYRKITGKVITEANMKPVAGSIITFNDPIKNKAIGTITDSEGKFVLDSIPTTVTKITVVNVSSNKSKEVTLTEEENIEIKME